MKKEATVSKFFWTAIFIIIASGLYRLIVLQKITLPTIRLFELGIFLPALYITLRRGYSLEIFRRIIFSIPRKVFLSVVTLTAYILYAYWALAAPHLIGSDTPKYLYWTQKLATHLLDLTFLKLFFTNNMLEPIPLLLFATLYRLGLPFEVIPKVVVPAFLAFSIPIFYKLSRRFIGEREAMMGTLVFAISPLHLRLALDLFRQAMGYFFAMVTLYFACTEKGKIPWKTTVFLLLTALSHAAPAVIVILTATIFIIISGRWIRLKEVNQELIRNNFIKMLIIYFVCALMIAPYTYWSLWIEKQLANASSYLEKPLLLAFPQAFYHRLHLTFELFEWCSSLTIMGFLGFYEATRRKEPYSLLTSLLLSTLITISFALFLRFFWTAPDRWGLIIDIPLAFFATYYISKRHYYLSIGAFLLVVLWTFIDSISFGFAYMVT